MINLTVTVLSYDKSSNTCAAKDEFCRQFSFDPFVDCAIPLSDEDYHAGKGGQVVGKTYIMTKYSFDGHHVVPYSGGLIEVQL
jgi:hypothetical protein